MGLRGRQSKLAHAQIFELQVLKHQGVKAKDIAARFDCTIPTIQYHWYNLKKPTQKGTGDLAQGSYHVPPPGLLDHIRSVVAATYGDDWSVITIDNVQTVMLGAYIEGPFRGHPYLREIENWKGTLQTKLRCNAKDLRRSMQGRRNAENFSYTVKTEKVELGIARAIAVPKEGRERLSFPDTYRFSRQIEGKRLCRTYRTLEEARAMKALFQEALDAGEDPFVISNWEVAARALTME